MSIIVKQNGTDISSSIDPKSLKLSLVLTKQVSTCRFRIKETPQKVTLVIGDQIDVYDGSTHLFGGTITEPHSVVMGGILIGVDYTSLDWSFRMNSKLVVKKYVAQDPHDIVLDIIANFTDGTFTTTNVQTGGFNVSSIKFNYASVTNALETLANQIGWEWFVDADKDVHFFPPDAVSNAPFDIDDTSGKQEWPTLDIDQNIQNIKNHVFVIGGTYSNAVDATTTPDVYKTDGAQIVFPLGYTYDPTTIVVTLAGVGQSVGVDGQTDPVTVQVLYNQASRFIKFTAGAPTTGQTVKIYGNQLIGIIASSQSNESISLYGERQDAIINQQISSVEQAQETANAEIARYGTPVYTIRFSTLQTGLTVGQTIRINSTKFNTDVLVVIQKIDVSMYSNTQMRYSIECVGTKKVSFVDVMKLLLLQANAQTVIDDNTILQVLVEFAENVTITDTVATPTTSSPPYLWGSFTWGFAAWS